MRREVILPADESALGLARSSLDGAIPPPTLDGRSDDPRLALTELVTNALRHGGLRPDRDTMRLVIEADEEAVRVEVEQPTTAADVRVVEGPVDGSRRVGGYGMRIVEHTADSWGSEPGPPGRVWFEFLH